MSSTQIRGEGGIVYCKIVPNTSNVRTRYLLSRNVAGAHRTDVAAFVRQEAAAEDRGHCNASARHCLWADAATQKGHRQLDNHSTGISVWWGLLRGWVYGSIGTLQR